MWFELCILFYKLNYKMKYVKEELEKLILEENLSYEEIGREYKVSGTYIKKISRRLGISLPIRQIFPDGFVPFNKGKVKVTSSEGTIIRTGKNKGTIYKIPEPVFCINCHIQCDTFAKKFCCKKCQDEYLSNEKYKEFLEDNGKYCTDVYIPKLFKRYFLSEQENKCDICKMENIWNRPY